MHSAGSIGRSHCACAAPCSPLPLSVLRSAPRVPDPEYLGSLHPERPGSMIQTLSHLEIPWTMVQTISGILDLMLSSWISLLHLLCSPSCIYALQASWPGAFPAVEHHIHSPGSCWSRAHGCWGEVRHPIWRSPARVIVSVGGLNPFRDVVTCGSATMHPESPLVLTVVLQGVWYSQ